MLRLHVPSLDGLLRLHVPSLDGLLRLHVPCLDGLPLRWVYHWNFIIVIDGHNISWSHSSWNFNFDLSITRKIDGDCISRFDTTRDGNFHLFFDSGVLVGGWCGWVRHGDRSSWEV